MRLYDFPTKKDRGNAFQYFLAPSKIVILFPFNEQTVENNLKIRATIK